MMKPVPSLTSRLPAFALPVLASLAALLPFAPAVAGGAPAKLPLSVFCFDYARDLKSVSVKTGTSDYHEVALSTANVIDAGEALAENGIISLFGPPADGVEHPVVASVETGTIRKPLVVLAPAADGGQPAYRSHVVDGDDATFPMGSYYFVNLSPHKVRITFGKHSTEFEPGTDKLFKPNVPAGEPLAVTIDYQVKDNWLLLSNSRWSYRKDRRTLVCIQLSPQTGRMLIKSVPLR